MKALFFSLLTLGALVSPSLSITAAANGPAAREFSAMTTATAHPTPTFLPMDSHREVRRTSVLIDGNPAELTRHERSDGRNAGLFGEHISVLHAPDGRLKGFARLSLDLAGEPLPDREETENIARAFLADHAPDLLPTMKISWIEPHDETIVDRTGGAETTVTVTGMKVKARNLADGTWFWVIVGGDRTPMVFERDIVWIAFPGHRQTEKWLHDNWLNERSG